MGFLRIGLIFALVATIAAGIWYFAVPWKKQVAGFQVQITDGTVVQVYLNDLHLGQTPLESQDVKPGTYQLRLEPEGKSGKQSYETQIHLYPGSISSVLWNFSGSDPSGTGDILELEPIGSKDRSELSVVTVPEGASVLLNTTAYGLSPVSLDSLDAGEYTLTLNAVGHTKKSLGVKTEKNYRLHVFSRLEKDAAPGQQAATEPTSPTAASDTATPIPEPTPKPANGNVVLTAPTPTPVTSPSPTPITTTKTATTPAKPYVTIKTTETGWLRVRSEASSAGTELAKVNVGQSFPYKSSVNGWYEIEYEAGKTGWISGQYGDLVR